MDSENRRTKVGGRYAEGSAIRVGTAKRKAPTEEGSREILNYLRAGRMPKSCELSNRILRS